LQRKFIVFYSHLLVSSTCLIKELLASGTGLDGKFQLSIHGGDTNIYLDGREGMVISGKRDVVLL